MHVMYGDIGPTTSELLAAFTAEVTDHAGRVTDAADDGRRLIARSVLPGSDDVRPGDRMQGGVAIRAAGSEVWVHPYLFRLVCRNGAIVARTVGTRHLVGMDFGDPAHAIQAVREAVASCCEPDVFADTVGRVRRTADELTCDLELSVLPMLARLSTGAHRNLLVEVMTRMTRVGDLTRFGLANAVTATAREILNPDLRWNLEELGGGIAAGVSPETRGPIPLAAARDRRGRLSGAAC
jgi:hypothetical protein